MRTYQAYLFDWDGTLARTVEVWLQTLEIVITEMGGKPDMEYLARTFGDWRAPLACGIDEARFEEFQKALTTQAIDGLKNVPLYEHAAECISGLHQEGKQLGLITSSVRESLEIGLHRHKLAELFGVIITAHDVKNHKPDPEGIHEALKHLRVSKDQAVMLGDSSKDLEAAQRAGVDSILFYPPSHELFYDLQTLKQYKPTHVIRDWKEFLEA